MRQPELIISADWSKDESKRWMGRAELRPGDASYRVYPPEPVGEIGSLVDRLTDQLPSGGTLMLGFDFPIGIPQAYAAKAGLLPAGFRAALGLFGQQEPWQSFYDVSDSPEVCRPFYPPPTQSKRLYNKEALRIALGVQEDRDLLRLCDRKTDTRPAAECMFFTLGSKQVGRALIEGWSNVLSPELNRLRLWPFDGELERLLAEPGVVVVELYPGESYSHVGLDHGLGKGLSKRRRQDRRNDVVRGALLGQKNENIELTDAAVSWINWGFLAEDDFDAMVGLFSMLQVVTGRRPDGVPDDSAVRAVEGWILGQPHSVRGA